MRILGDDTVLIRTILVDNAVAGNVMSYVFEERTEVTYWIGKEYWGQGVTTAALTQFLILQTTRPVYARVAKDNAASIRVLEKCGFEVCDEGKGFANARGEEIEEFVMVLDKH